MKNKVYSATKGDNRGPTVLCIAGCMSVCSSAGFISKTAHIIYVNREQDLTAILNTTPFRA